VELLNEKEFFGKICCVEQLAGRSIPSANCSLGCYS